MADRVEMPEEASLRRRVTDALSHYEPIRIPGRDGVTVEVTGGIVKLRGHVTSGVHSATAARLVRAVPGVQEVIIELIADDMLERMAAAAISLDSTTRSLRVVVHVVGGVATLYGIVPNSEIGETVRDTVSHVPGLLGVKTMLQVVPPGARVIVAWQQSVEGRPLAETATEENHEDTAPESGGETRSGAASGAGMEEPA